MFYFRNVIYSKMLFFWWDRNTAVGIEQKFRSLDISLTNSRIHYFRCLGEPEFRQTEISFQNRVIYCVVVGAGNVPGVLALLHSFAC